MVAPFPVCVPIHALSIPTYSIAACQLSLRGPLVSSLSIIVPSAASRIKCWDSINSIVIHSPSHHGWSCLQLPQEFQNTSLNPAGIIYVHSPPTMIGHGSSCFRNSIPTSLCLVISFSHLKNPPGNSLLIRLLVLALLSSLSLALRHHLSPPLRSSEFFSLCTEKSFMCE